MNNPCNCYYGENCTKTTVCANESVVQDLEAEIERLTTEASCAAHNAAEYHDIIRGQRKRIAELEAALRYIQTDSDEIIIVAAQTISKYAREALANSEGENNE